MSDSQGAHRQEVSPEDRPRRVAGPLALTALAASAAPALAARTATTSAIGSPELSVGLAVPVGSQDLVTSWACHRAAFNHFGGIPDEILYDPTKTVIGSHVAREGARVYHPEALASAHHYGFKLRLCRLYRPQTKGKVESDVSYVRERLLRGNRAKRQVAIPEVGVPERQAPPGGAGGRGGRDDPAQTSPSCPRA